jgi:hypothetical protein
VYPKDKTLRVFTDCLGLVQIVRRWTRGDFAPRPEDEKHWDILEELLRDLSARTEDTQIIWIRSHRGDGGNEIADQQAVKGCSNTDGKRYDRPRDAFELRELHTLSQVSPHAWTQGAERYCRDFIGRITLQRLKQGTAKSTEALLREGMGREYMGTVLKDVKGLGSHTVRDFLQVRGLCFPTATMVNKYTRGRTAEVCPLCDRDPETIAHMLMGCHVTQGARNKLHDRVAESLLDSIRKGGLMGVKVWTRPTGWKLDRKLTEEPGTHLTGTRWWTPPARLTDHEYWRSVWPLLRTKEMEHVAKLTPDGVVWDHHQRRIWIVEFTRSMADGTADMERRKARKAHAYHALVLHLRARLQDYPEYVIKQHTYVMGALGSMPVTEWRSHLGEVGLKDKAVEKCLTGAMRECVAGIHEYLNVRRALSTKGIVSQGIG